MKIAKDVSNLLAQRAEEIAQMLLPNGKKEGTEWVAGNVHGDAGKSLKVHLSGAKAGVWSDFAVGRGGDLLDLWAAKTDLSIAAALKEACDYLGIKTQKFEAHKPKVFSKPKRQQFSLPALSPVMEYLTEQRFLSKETIEAFQIGEENNDIVFPSIRDGKTIFVKYMKLKREDGKKVMRTEKDCEPCLFGWHLIPKDARSITICEGEIDAMSLYQYGFPALSVPFGAGSGKKHEWIEYEFERLGIFDEIFLCFDDDEEGRKATEWVAQRLGLHRCRVVQLPAKDVNDCLVGGLPAAHLQYYFDDAKTIDPEELKSALEFLQEVIDAFYPPDGKEPGYLAPWEKCNDKILFRPNELCVWTGINGHGKSQFLGQVMLGMMNQGAKICVASLELKPRRFLLRMTRQAVGINCPAPDYIKGVHEWYEDKLWLFDLLGSAKSGRLLEVFLYAHQRYGIDVFVIDSFMKLDIAEDDYKSQKSFIEKLCDFKNQYSCQVHIVVHPRKGADESSSPGKLDTKGTGAITDLADNCFTVWRNKAREKVLKKQKEGYMLEDKEQKYLDQSDCILKCDKQRNGDWEGSIGFWFDQSTFQYLGGEQHKPTKIITYNYSWKE